MRPDMSDVLNGIKQTLTEEIIPALSSSYAREQATYVLFLLEHCLARWDKAHIFYGQENDDLCALLESVVQNLRGAPVADAVASLIRDVEKALAAEKGVHQGERPLLSLREGNRVLRELACRLVDALEGKEGMARVREKFLAYTQRQLERDREWVKIGEILW